MKSQKFIPSSRLQALETNSSKSIGASCNVYQAQDSINSIADAHSWSYQVLAYQGAPSVDFSQLRPRDSKLGTGGKSSGSVSFMQPFDAIVSTMRREEKKNGAGIAYLDYRHPDLQEFLDVSFKSAYKGVYIPMHDTPEADAFVKDTKLMKTLAKAYNEFRCFLVKRPLPVNDEPLFTNLCTEVEIPHRGTCILGAHNLAAYATLEQFEQEFANDFCISTQNMLRYFNLSQAVAKVSPLSCNSPLNRQFGLGVLGLASVLGDFGITYADFGHLLNETFDFTDDNLDKARARLRKQEQSPVESAKAVVVFTRTLLDAYAAAAAIARPHVRAAFCIQPTVSTSQRTFDTKGYNVSPEIQPAIGLKHPEGVSTIVKSVIKGDNQVNYSPNTWTIDEVTYDEYAKVSSAYQRLLDSTALAHRHSHCFYGSAFTPRELKRLYTNTSYNRIKSLYYRLPSQVNTESLRKDKLWQDVSEGEIADFSVEELLSSCNLFTGDSNCDCTM